MGYLLLEIKLILPYLRCPIKLSFWVIFKIEFFKNVIELFVGVALHIHVFQNKFRILSAHAIAINQMVRFGDVVFSHNPCETEQFVLSC
jgi:HJR/Mrr/RecB family endonuclease